MSRAVVVSWQFVLIMAGEEDVELRDLVAHTLETRGILGKIRVSVISWVDCGKLVA